MRVLVGRERSHLFLGIAGGITLIGLVFAGARHMTGGGAPRLTGTSLGEHDAAPDFRLRDSGGQAYSLSQFRGKVVVLTFLYTHCPDVCPLTAELLRQVDQQAGHPPDVVYLAVSVDPAGDTPESIASFTEEHHLDQLGDRWHYLVGALPELSRVWQMYYIRDHNPAPPGEQVDHASAIYFIDKQGNRRVLTHVDTPASAMARNEQILLRR